MPRRTHALRDCATLALPLSAPPPAPALLSTGTLFATNRSGRLRPAADELITSRVRGALALVDIRVLDHFVVTGDVIVSFAERGLLGNPSQRRDHRSRLRPGPPVPFAAIGLAHRSPGRALDTIIVYDGNIHSCLTWTVSSASSGMRVTAART